MKIYDVDLLKLIPVFMRKDSFNIYLSIYLNSIIQNASKNINKLSIWNTIDELNDEECDIVAKELNLDFYRVSETLTEKHFKLKTGIQTKMSFCTKTSLQKALETYYRDAWNMEIIEWFEFDGKPFHFKIFATIPESQPVNQSVLDDIKLQVERFKNMRSILDEVLLVKQYNKVISSVAVEAASYYEIEKSLGETEDVINLSDNTIILLDNDEVLLDGDFILTIKEE